ncbi:hypothetical protein GCM10022276_28810 [Sphingomonas limnosediminicola]|uniref:PEP-CTERM protein-sorting domain-containing protein n=1 Tax=Sphingomonas limnosediminicola TaxID=940133 RepID=A0ABP7LUF8_9SPHN
MRKVILAAFGATAFGLSAPATATQELVTNGGFETGDFGGWLQTGLTSRTVVCGSSCAHSGSLGAALGATFGTGTLSQVLTTIPGQSYDVSFWLANEPDLPIYSFDFRWGGGTRLSLGSGSGPFGYSLETFTLIATDTATQIAFEFEHDRTFWYLDDVSVRATSGVPELGTWTMLLLGFGTVGLALRRRRSGKIGEVGQLHA